MRRYDRVITDVERAAVLGAFRGKPCTAADVCNRMTGHKADQKRVLAILPRLARERLVYSYPADRWCSVYTITGKGKEALARLTAGRAAA